MNNSTIDPRCQWYITASEHTRTIAYYGIFPIHFCLCMIGHTLCLRAFYRQSKKESPYIYQLMVTISEMLEIFTGFLYVLTYRLLSGTESHSGVPWFMANYFCMWFAAHIAPLLVNSFILLSTLLSVSVVIDRVFALARPFKHKTYRARRCHLMAFGVCFFLSVGSSVYVSFRLRLSPTDNGYAISVNDIFMQSSIHYFLAQLRNGIKTVCLVFLLTFNLALIQLYRRQVQRSISISISHSSKAIKRKEQEKTLTLLAIFQAIFSTVATLYSSIYSAILYTRPEMQLCEGVLLTVIQDMVYGLCDMADFYIVFAVSRRFRRMILASVPMYGRFSSMSRSE